MMTIGNTAGLILLFILLIRKLSSTLDEFLGRHTMKSTAREIMHILFKVFYSNFSMKILEDSFSVRLNNAIHYEFICVQFKDVETMINNIYN